MRFYIEVDVVCPILLSDDQVIDLRGLLRNIIDNSSINEVIDDGLFHSSLCQEIIDRYHPDNRLSDDAIMEIGEIVRLNPVLSVKSLRLVDDLPVRIVQDSSPRLKHRVVDRMVEECGCEDQRPIDFFYVVGDLDAGVVELELRDFIKYVVVKSTIKDFNFFIFTDLTSADNFLRRKRLLRDAIEALEGLNMAELADFLETKRS